MDTRESGEDRGVSYTLPRKLTDRDKFSDINSDLPGSPIRCSPDRTTRKCSTTSYLPLSAVADPADNPQETVYEVYRNPTLNHALNGKSHSHVNGNGANHAANHYTVNRVPDKGGSFLSSQGPPTWCRCSQCSHSDQTGTLCCAKLPELSFLLENSEKFVTNTLLFNQIVLNKTGLKYGDWVGKKWLLSKEVHRDECSSAHRSYRHLAYNAFVNLVSSELRAQWSHKVLPSCVVSAIRRVYPSGDGAYSGIVRST